MTGVRIGVKAEDSINDRIGVRIELRTKGG